ncbi:MAG: DUF4388 domain-containing protein [Deltaproteobacteria bacterium]|nr:DUF4388 domain-containing protein [Deltaproteobacteria bacterium]MBW2360383.1 DUF4388 domain-containing protein [Deltaproteobacteria bacterium]
MSLVGSLEDLGLGDILQIVSLARKSGLLFMRASSGEGRIVFEDGLVRAAYLKQAPETLAGLLAAGGFAELEPIDRVVAQFVDNGSGWDERDARVAEAAGMPVERLQSLCRESVERAVLEMFSWRAGEFSFDVCENLDERFGELALPVGINAQYLMLEATRLGDECPDAIGSCGEEFELSGEDGGVLAAPLLDPEETGAVDAHQVVDVAAAAAVASSDLGPELFAALPELTPASDPVAAAEPLSDSDASAATESLSASDAPAASDSLAEFDAHVPSDAQIAPDPCDAFEAQAPPGREAKPAAETTSELRESPRPAATAAVPLVVIDAELMALEWLKQRLAPLFSRIHIFQHSEGGVARIRQYLGRGVVPVVLVSSRVPADSLTGAREAGELVRRMRAQAPRMPIMAMFDSDEEGLPQGLDAADAVLVRPSLRLLADDRRRAETERMADELRRALASWSVLGDEPSADAPEPVLDEVLNDPAS